MDSSLGLAGRSESYLLAFRALLLTFRTFDKASSLAGMGVGLACVTRQCA